MGGQFILISIFGEILEWKYAQKKDVKNIISDEMNIIIPSFILFEILFECILCMVVSLMIFIHHINMFVIIINVINMVFFILKLFDILLINKIVMFHEDNVFKIGHGLFVTM
jgi:hypothetical protein